MRAPAIVASVLGADYARLGQEVAELEAAGVDRIQWDIMDCRFVPNLSLSANVVAACRPHATLPYEAHLIIARSGLQTLIEVDGGISAAPAPRAVRAGAQLLVASSAILAHPDGRPAAVAELRRSLQPDVEALRE